MGGEISKNTCKFNDKKHGVMRVKIVSTEAEIIQIDTAKGGSMRAYDPCGNMLSPTRIVELLKEAMDKVKYVMDMQSIFIDEDENEDE